MENNKFNKSRLLGVSLITSLALSACSSSQDNHYGLPELPKVTVQEKNLPEINDLVIDGETIGTIRKISHSKTDIEAEKKQYEIAAIHDLAVDPTYNAEIFRIAGPESLDKIYLAPKTYVYGSTDGQSSAIENEDGTVTVPFNIALISGLNKTVSSPLGGSGASIEIPEVLRVQKQDELKTFIKNKYGNESILTPMFGCPKHISISAAGKEYDATPRVFSEGNYCEYEKPFTVSLTVKKADLVEIYEAIDKGYADVFVRFQTKVPVTVAALYAEFDRDKLFEKIHAKLNAHYDFWAQADIEIAIQKVLYDSKANIFILGDQSEQMKNLVTKIIEEFFKPLTSQPNISSSNSCQAAVCLSVQYVKSTENQKMSVSWTQSAPYLVDMNLISMAKLRPANEITYKVGGDEVPFTNYSANQSHTLALSPNYGDIIIFKPTQYSYEDRRRDELMISNREWEDCVNRKYFPGGNVCVEKRNFSEQTFIHSLPEGQNFVTLTDIMSQAPTLLEGIELEFTFTNKEKVSCSLLSMYGQGIDGGRIVRVMNSDGCTIYNNERKQIASVTVVNKIRHPEVTFIDGQRYQSNFQGGNSSYHNVSYSPKIRMKAELKHRTRMIESDSSTTKVVP